MSARLKGADPTNRTGGHKRRTVVGLLVFNIITVGFVLVAAEAGVRMWRGVALTRTDNFIARQLGLMRQSVGIVAHDPQLGWRLAENVYTKEGDFTTGRYGIRMNSNEIREPAPGGILVVGDSFTLGSQVDDNHSWPAQLETMIARPVLNAASGGWGVDQMVLRAEQLVPATHPRALIVSVLAQDSFRNGYEIYGSYKPYFVIENERLILKGVPVPTAPAHQSRIGPLREVLGRSFLVHWLMMRARPTWWVNDQSRYKRINSDRAGVEISCRLMARLARLRDEHHLRMVVGMQYSAPEAVGKEPPWYGPPVLSCAAAQGFDTVDTYPTLNAMATWDSQRFTRLWVNEGGQLGHMSAAGNALVAGLFRDALLKR